MVDEFGGVSGLITLNDMMSAIIGTLPEREQSPGPTARREPDGSWIADAMIGIDDLLPIVPIPIPEADLEESDYRTLGGLVLHHLGHVPQEGETFDFAGHRFDVIDMDRHRIDKVRIRPLPPATGEGADDSGNSQH